AREQVIATLQTRFNSFAPATCFAVLQLTAAAWPWLRARAIYIFLLQAIWLRILTAAVPRSAPPPASSSSSPAPAAAAVVPALTPSGYAGAAAVGEAAPDPVVRITTT